MGFVLCLFGVFFISLFAWRFAIVWGLFFKNLYGNIINSDTRGEDTVSIEQIHMGQLE